MSCFSQKVSIQRAYNNYFIDLLDELSAILPNDKDIIISKTYFLNIKKINPSIIIKCWYKYVFLPYSKEIQEENIMFFFFKNYEDDLVSLNNKDEVLQIINKFKKPLQNLDEDNLAKIKVFIKNLNTLSILFAETSVEEKES